MAWSQDEIIFPAHAVGGPGPLPAGGERISIVSGSETLHGVHIPGSGSHRQMLVLGFGGNAWNGQDVGSFLHDLYPDAEVVAFHYRGYRPSTGRPSADALLADAPLVYDAAVERVKPNQVIVVGFSIGSAIAASLAKRRSIDGLILVTPFDSLKAVAGELYPGLPIGPFFRHELNTVEHLAGSKVPVAMVAASEDEIVPPRRTAALRQLVPNLVFDRTIARAGHNDLYLRPEFRAAMGEALGTLSTR